MENNNNVNHPNYYNTGKIEVIDAITDWNLGFDLGNAVKYIARAGKKDAAKTVEDLEKAVWYINHYIKNIKSEDNSGSGTLSDLIDFILGRL